MESRNRGLPLDRAADNDLSISNEELLDLCVKQDQEALRLLLRRHERSVYSLLYRMLSNPEDAEDALAEVFVKVWRGAAGFKRDAKFTTWLFRIASNTARDFLRSRKSRTEVSIDDTILAETQVGTAINSSTPDPEKSAIAADDRARIIQAMQSLSEEDRMLVELYHIQERDYDEIAQITGIPESNLKVKLFRARQRLKKLCAEQERSDVSDEMRRSAADSTGLQSGAAECA